MAGRTVPGGRAEAKARLATAEAYLQSAEFALKEAAKQEFTTVAAGNAVLAGIAASDSICCSRLRQMHRGDDHRAAGQLLQSATPDGKTLSVTLARLLELKDGAHYSATPISSRRAADAIRWARKLIERAREETER